MAKGAPRIDRIVKRPNERTEDARTLKGTPTQGANLANLRGCPPLPDGYDTVSFILLPESMWKAEADG